MGLLRAMFLLTAVASLVFAAGLLVPDPHPAPGVGPEDFAWSSYLVLIYLGLAIISWLAYRRPDGRGSVPWAFTPIWGGLALGYLLNMWRSDEPVAMTTVALLLFDSIMFALILGGTIQDRCLRPSGARAGSFTC